MGNSDSKDKEITHGLRIIKIFEDSPAKKTDLCIYTDFIVDIANKPEGFKLDRDFYKFVIMNENQTIRMFVYNILTQQTRYIDLFLTRDWPNSDFLLGFKVRIENLKNAQKNIYRILNVFNPAMQQIVVAKKFFFMAIEEFSFNDLDDLKQKLRLYQKCNIIFFDINTVNIIIVPFVYNPRTGLGFELGTGYLHDLQFIIQSLIKNREKMNSLSYRDREIDQTIEMQKLKEQYKQSFQNQEQQKLGMKKQNQDDLQSQQERSQQNANEQTEKSVQQQSSVQQDQNLLQQGDNKQLNQQVEVQQQVQDKEQKQDDQQLQENKKQTEQILQNTEKQNSTEEIISNKELIEQQQQIDQPQVIQQNDDNQKQINEDQNNTKKMNEQNEVKKDNNEKKQEQKEDQKDDEVNRNQKEDQKVNVENKEQINID